MIRFFTSYSFCTSGNAIAPESVRTSTNASSQRRIKRSPSVHVVVAVVVVVVVVRFEVTSYNVLLDWTGNVTVTLN